MYAFAIENNDDSWNYPLIFSSRSDILKEILNERFVVIGRKKTTTTTIGEGEEL